MAIIKLGDISLIKRGSSPRPINEWLRKKGLMWAKISDLNNNFLFQTKEFIKSEWENKGLVCYSGDLLLTNSATPGVPFIQVAEKVAYHDGFLAIKCNSKIIKKKYLFYKLIVDKPKLLKMGTGAVFINLSLEILKNWEIELPNLIEQQQIIDIIEPNEKLFLKYSNCVKINNFETIQKDMKNLIDIIEPLEELKNNLNKQLELFSKYSEFIMTEYNILEKMNKRCQFLKGESVANFSKGQTLFLNVAAANGNSNKYCDNTPNVFPKDVTLSLDGNTGLVNNNLLGFNGYLYKLKSEVIPNWQIYYSLKNKINQKVIKLNEIGTTIKHSSNSKKELLLLDFKQKNILEKIFYFEINLKNQIYLIEKQIKKIISILIK